MSCADVWLPDEPNCSHIVCDRDVTNGAHSGKHMYHDPETGRVIVSWWGGPRETKE